MNDYQDFSNAGAVIPVTSRLISPECVNNINSEEFTQSSVTSMPPETADIFLG